MVNRKTQKRTKSRRVKGKRVKGIRDKGRRVKGKRVKGKRSRRGGGYFDNTKYIDINSYTYESDDNLNKAYNLKCSGVSRIMNISECKKMNDVLKRRAILKKSLTPTDKTKSKELQEKQENERREREDKIAKEEEDDNFMEEYYETNLNANNPHAWSHDNGYDDDYEDERNEQAQADNEAKDKLLQMIAEQKIQRLKEQAKDAEIAKAKAEAEAKVKAETEAAAVEVKAKAENAGAKAAAVDVNSQPTPQQLENTKTIELLRKVNNYKNQQEIKRLTQENQRMDDIRKQRELYAKQAASGTGYEQKKYDVELKQPTNGFDRLRGLFSPLKAAGGGKRRTNKRRTNKRNTNKRRTNKRNTNKRRTNKRNTNKRNTRKR